MKRKILLIIYGLIIGILLGIIFSEIFFPKQTEIKTFKIPVVIPEIREKVVIIQDTFLQRNLLSVIESLQIELQKAKLAGQFNWKTWNYDDKYLNAKIKYFGLLKDFEYTIKQRDTIIQYQTIFKYKQKIDWKTNLLFGFGGFILGYVLSK